MEYVAADPQMYPKRPPNVPQMYPRCTFAGNIQHDIINMSNRDAKVPVAFLFRKKDEDVEFLH